MSETDEELIRQLTELAVTNPGQLPIAMLGIIRRRLMQVTVLSCQSVLEACLVEFENELRRAFGISGENP